MAHPVTRIYDTDQKAAEAVSHLKEYGFTPDRITLIDSASQADTNAVANALAAKGLSPAEAADYARDVANGAALVSVDPPFGHALAAADIMDRCGSVEAEQAQTDTAYEPHGEPYDHAAPLSDAVHAPVLIEDRQAGAPASETHYEDNPAPFSSALGLPVLTKRRSSGSLLPSDWTLSGLLGLKLLTDTQTPATSRTAVNKMSEHPAPLSEAVHAPVLTEDDSAPNQHETVPPHVDNPAPLSDAVGAPVLTGDRRA